MLPKDSNLESPSKPFRLLLMLVWFYLGVIVVATLVAGLDGAKYSTCGSLACLWLVVLTNHLLPIPNPMYRMLVGTMLRTVVGLVMVGVAVRVLGFEQKMAVFTAVPLYLGMIGVEIMEALRSKSSGSITGLKSPEPFPQA